MKRGLKKDILISLAITGIVCGALIAFIFLRHQIHCTSKRNVELARVSALFAGNAMLRSLSTNQSLSIEAAFYDALSALRVNSLSVQALLYSTNGIVRASSRPADLSRRASPSELNFINLLIEFPTQHNTAISVDKKNRIVHIYCLLKTNQADLYVVRFDAALGNIRGAIQQIYILLISILLLQSAAVIWLWVLLNKRVFVPVALLNIAAKEISEGDSSLRIDIQSMDELAELAATINALSSAIQNHSPKARRP